ncbi:unnamed protein product, partial [Symbiodinium pilosum]
TSSKVLLWTTLKARVPSERTTDVRYRRLCLLIESLALLTTICLLVFAWMLGFLIWIIKTKLVTGLVIVASMRAFTRPVHPTFDFASEGFGNLYFRGALPLPSQALAYSITSALVEAEVADGKGLQPDPRISKPLLVRLMGTADAEFLRNVQRCLEGRLAASE